MMVRLLINIHFCMEKQYTFELRQFKYKELTDVTPLPAKCKSSAIVKLKETYIGDNHD